MYIIHKSSLKQIHDINVTTIKNIYAYIKLQT